MPAYDVVVVGGGAMGASTAYHLTGRGARVVLLEQYDDVGHDRGSSHGPSRIFRLGYPQPHFVALAQRALPEWRALEEAAATELLTTTGGLDHGDPETLAAVESALASAGAAVRRVPTAEATERWPGIRTDGRDALFHAEAGVIAADETVRALHRLAASAGAEIRYGARVAAITERPDAVHLETAVGDVSAAVVVLAAGSWLPKLADGLDLDLPPLTVTQQQPAYFDTTNDWPVFIHHDGSPAPHYGLPTPGLGLKVGRHGPGRAVDPDDRPPVDDDELADLERHVEQWLPGATPHATRVDSCLYTSTPDEEFVLRRRGPVVVCSACSGHGFKFVPVIGARVAELATA